MDEGLGVFPRFDNETVAIIFSLVTQGSQNSPETIRAHFEAIEKTRCAKLLIIICDMPNESMLPLNHQSMDPMLDRRIRAFELGVNFLKNPENVALILNLTVPFEILCAFQLMYENIPGITVESLFCKPRDKSEEAMASAIEDTVQALDAWADTIKQAFSFKQPLLQRSYMTALSCATTRRKQIKYYAAKVKSLVASVSKREQNQHFSKAVIEEFIDNEAALSIRFGYHNDESIRHSGQKAFSTLVYTGGPPNQPLEDVRKVVVPAPSRWEQYFLTKQNLLISVDAQQSLSAEELLFGSAFKQPRIASLEFKFRTPRPSYSAPSSSRTEAEEIESEPEPEPLSPESAAVEKKKKGSRIALSASDTALIKFKKTSHEERREVKTVAFLLNPFLINKPADYALIKEYFQVFQEVGCVKIKIVFLDLFHVDLNSQENLCAKIDLCAKILKDLADLILEFKFPYQIVLGSQFILDVFQHANPNIQKLFEGSRGDVLLKIDQWAKDLKQSLPQDIGELSLNTRASASFKQAHEYYKKNINGFKNSVKSWVKKTMTGLNTVDPVLEKNYKSVCLLLSTLYLMLINAGVSNTLYSSQKLESFLQCLERGPQLSKRTMPHLNSAVEFLSQFGLILPGHQLSRWVASGNSIYSVNECEEAERVAKEIVTSLKSLPNLETMKLALKELKRMMQTSIMTDNASETSPERVFGL